MLRLSRLKVNKYRNVQPCELLFHDDFNVLLGENGSGKTTLLKLISGLYREDVRRFGRDEPLDLELDFKGEANWRASAHLVNKLPERQATGGAAPDRRERTRRTLSVDIQLKLSGQMPVRLFNNPSTMAWSVQQGDTPPLSPVPGLSDEPDSDWTAASVLSLVGLAAQTVQFHAIAEEVLAARLPVRFDESTEFKELLKQFEVHASYARDRLMSCSPGGLVVPESLMKGVDTQALADPDVPYLRLDGDQVEFLREFCRLTGLRQATFHGERTERRAHPLFSDAPTVVFSKFGFSFTRRDGSIFPQEHLSYGQQRLLFFLCYLDATPQVVIADELVNGMHHRWLKRCMELIGHRQAFLTSQNPLLLDCLAFDSQEQVQRTFLLCAREDEAQERLTWRNLSAEEAEVFFRAYEVGLQHVGEILQSKGLW